MGETKKKENEDPYQGLKDWTKRVKKTRPEREDEDYVKKGIEGCGGMIENLERLFPE